MSDADFFKDFPPVTKKEWEQRILKDLKGKPLDTLSWEVAPGVEVKPAYHPDEFEGGVFQSTGKAQNSWDIGEVIDGVINSYEEANSIAKKAVAFGAEALLFTLSFDVDETSIKKLLAGLDPDNVKLCFTGFNSFEEGVALGKKVASIIKSQNPEGTIGFQPFKKGLTTDPVGVKTYFSSLSSLLPGYELFEIDVAALSKGHDTVPHEIAEAVHQLRKFIDLLLDADLPVEDYLSKLYYKVGVGTSYFVEIAKVRALRWLTSEVLKAYQLNEDLHITIEAHLAPTSFKEDQYQNMIQSTTQAISAVVGGVDRLIVLPSNANIDQPTSFTRRIARNVQHLLKLESHLDLVKDPAAGSYYVETLTEKLGQAAWDIFGKNQ